MAKPSHTGTGKFRIIAGQWRGRKFPIADAEGLRPTTDRVRETVFNWLQPVVVDSQCLDLFAGSGSLGFEAASRGAKFVTFIEKQSAVARQLQRNIQTLGEPQLQAIEADALQWLQHTPAAPYSLIFLDPPFQQQLLMPAIELLQQPGYTEPGSYIYIEHEKGLALALPPHWQILKDKTFGQVQSTLIEVTE
ncbi:16S rRNA (guanine(966)-N(2))-methyltransferase RsmD [Idiomarina tyrosinivorans]|uniref:Ribosomal RNA small subunit methyltransferase D n=1 Tax=Idiomarina tyrosinivorans TaxID=1445662 RepID=A0A432ZTE4_9GAMM|nr:16S rRNA (guanine(966)-N(2))-methyltransferase RsmD [Idiomarina tyrosinivorans]RUO81122.1 16S rRNA (guanine(966)-N(2))-methyltransferase RsmD [Idiomarina tyrosinivorans]